ncbi:hypothetical protein PoB_005544400 [Plakobranchus ocellatus]|uniref:Uncharacterized protein n=1 Tax=Plakobranchus ocellatus TaxID=259542 RepID=A0AAV4C8Q3_9GAST|nr:hypothetical protein PoB_005544400 [Plakobranchus ocellatus]
MSSPSVLRAIPTVASLHQSSPFYLQGAAAEINTFCAFRAALLENHRGSMNILRKLWTKDIHEPDVKSSHNFAFTFRNCSTTPCRLSERCYKGPDEAEALLMTGWRDEESFAGGKDRDEGNCGDDSGCEVLPELDGWDSKETVKDLKFGDDLSTEQQYELEELAGCFSAFFSDRSGSAT